jgi:hypothetical protein
MRARTSLFVIPENLLGTLGSTATAFAGLGFVLVRRSRKRNRVL